MTISKVTTPQKEITTSTDINKINRNLFFNQIKNMNQNNKFSYFKSHSNPTFSNEFRKKFVESRALVIKEKTDNKGIDDSLAEKTKINITALQRLLTSTKKPPINTDKKIINSFNEKVEQSKNLDSINFNDKVDVLRKRCKNLSDKLNSINVITKTVENKLYDTLNNANIKHIFIYEENCSEPKHTYFYKKMLTDADKEKTLTNYKPAKAIKPIDGCKIPLKTIIKNKTEEKKRSIPPHKKHIEKNKNSIEKTHSTPLNKAKNTTNLTKNKTEDKKQETYEPKLKKINNNNVLIRKLDEHTFTVKKLNDSEIISFKKEIIVPTQPSSSNETTPIIKEIPVETKTAPIEAIGNNVAIENGEKTQRYIRINGKKILISNQAKINTTIEIESKDKKITENKKLIGITPEEKKRNLEKQQEYMTHLSKPRNPNKNRTHDIDKKSKKINELNKKEDELNKKILKLTENYKKEIKNEHIKTNKIIINIK